MDWTLIPLAQKGVSITVNEELRLFIQAAFSGMILFAIYDVLRIFRRICRHGIIWISVEDTIYWIFCGIFIFSVILKENSGIFRSFFAVGVVLGALLYYAGLSRYIVGFTSRVLKKILYVVARTVRFVAAPLKKVVIFGAKHLKVKQVKCNGIIKKKKKNIENL